MSDEHPLTDEAEALRAAVSARAECGWGCFCDACWSRATEAEKRHLDAQHGDQLGGELAVYDALWSLSFGAHADRAQALQEALARQDEIDLRPDAGP